MEFIPVAEANGMIIEIGEFVLREACRNARGLASDSARTSPLSVNLSARQLHESLVATILEILRRDRTRSVGR